MSRQLNKKQKSKVVEVMEAHHEIHGEWPYMVDDIDGETLEGIVALNDHETVYQNIERFMGDYRAEKIYGGRR